MAACEKCWADAYVAAMTRGGSQAEHYQRLIAEREAAGVMCAIEPPA